MTAVTANPHSRFSCGTPPHRDSWEAFWQVSQSAAGPPQRRRSTLSSSRETELLTLRIYWNKIYTNAHVSDGLLTFLTLQQFLVCRCYLNTVGPLQIKIGPIPSYILMHLFLSFYLSNLSRANQFCSGSLKGFWTVQWCIAKLISSRKWFVTWNAIIWNVIWMQCKPCWFLLCSREQDGSV